MRTVRCSGRLVGGVSARGGRGAQRGCLPREGGVCQGGQNDRGVKKRYLAAITLGTVITEQ